MNVLKNFKEVIQHPGLIHRGINITVNRTYHRLIRGDPYNQRGVRIFEEDWDNLIILDACRYDEFERIADSLPGALELRESRGSHSREFVEANFENKLLHDVVYLSCNLFFAKLQPELGCEIHRFASIHELEGWENTHPTYPETVTKHASEFASEYPNKRLIVHYIQPHTPFIGDTGREHFNMSDGVGIMWRRPELTDNILLKAYRENLKLVVDEVQNLLDDLDGRTVITADHGEFLGDRSSPVPVKEYGHLYGIHADHLVRVPWLVIDTGNRKRIVPEDPLDDESEKMNDKYIEQRLRDLGYKM